MNVLTPYMVNGEQWDWELKTGWFYAGIGLPMVIGMWLIIPETANRSPAELDELYERKIKPCKCSAHIDHRDALLTIHFFQGVSRRHRRPRKTCFRWRRSSILNWLPRGTKERR